MSGRSRRADLPREDGRLPAAPAGQRRDDGSLTSATNKGIGQRTQSSANGIVEQWQYDARGRKTTSTSTVPGLSGTRVFAYAYDSADQLTDISYPTLPSGQVQTLTYSYDAAGRPTRLYTNIWNIYLVNNATYTALSQPDQWTFNNGLVQNWTYSSPTQRLSRLQLGSGTPASMFDRSYSYDNNSNVTAITDNQAATNNQSYTYDHRDRLSTWTLNGTTQTYTYNALGNLTSKPGMGVYTYPASGPTSIRPHTPSVVNGANYSYDNNGNLTGGGGRTYTWNSDNLPASIAHVSGSESYSYDADGARVKKVAGSTTTVYLEGGLWEEVVGGTVKAAYTFNGQTAVLYTSSPSAFTYLTSDHLGSISVATSQAQVKTAQEYDPWGKVRSGGISATSINFTGQRLDATGLLYYNARMYDPVLGRFVSADTIVPDATNPQKLNRYSYVTNNPVNKTDPTGHVDKCDRCGGASACACGPMPGAWGNASAATLTVTVAQATAEVVALAATAAAGAAAGEYLAADVTTPDTVPDAPDAGPTEDEKTIYGTGNASQPPKARPGDVEYDEHGNVIPGSGGASSAETPEQVPTSGHLYKKKVSSADPNVDYVPDGGKPDGRGGVHPPGHVSAVPKQSVPFGKYNASHQAGWEPVKDATGKHVKKK